MLQINKIHCGDSIKLMKKIPDKSIDLVYTDPVWPNNSLKEFAEINPMKVFKKACKQILRITDRVAIHLGSNTNPQFLKPLFGKIKFFRVCWLEHTIPSRQGRFLNGSDVIYFFGIPPKSRPGNRVIPGRINDNSTGGARQFGHPCPRKYKHVSWVIEKFSNEQETVLDPFAGTCTTALACKNGNRNFICIEKEKDYCITGENRITQGVFNFG